MRIQCGTGDSWSSSVARGLMESYSSSNDMSYVDSWDEERFWWNFLVGSFFVLYILAVSDMSAQ